MEIIGARGSSARKSRFYGAAKQREKLFLISTSARATTRDAISSYKFQRIFPQSSFSTRDSIKELMIVEIIKVKILKF